MAAVRCPAVRRVGASVVAGIYRRRDPARTTKRLVTQLERLGHTVTLHDAKAA